MPDEPLHTPTGKYWEAEAACTRPRRVQEKGCSDGLDNGTDPLLSLLTRQRRGARAGMFRGVFEMRRERAWYSRTTRWTSAPSVGEGHGRSTQATWRSSTLAQTWSPPRRHLPRLDS